MNSAIIIHSGQAINTDTKQSNTRFALVQELRGFAALWVVLFHASAGGHLRALEYYLPALIDTIVFKAGHYGVAVFFALSGFVIAHSLRDTGGSFKGFGRFIVKRSIRLDPPYWTSMMLVLTLDYLASNLTSEPFSGVTIDSIVAHIFYAQVILGYPEINTVYWTLTYEIQFYLFFAFVLLVASSFTRNYSSTTWMIVAWAIMYVLALMSVLKLTSFLPKEIFIDLWPSFYIGALAYRTKNSRYARLFFAILLVMMCFLPKNDNFMRLSAATALLLAWSYYTGRILHGMGWKRLQAIGLISYSLYLIHNPITGAAGFTVQHLAGSSFISASIALVTIVSASLICSFLFWWAIERPAHRLSQAIFWSGLPGRGGF